MRRAARIDGNHGEIVAAFRRCGCHVIRLEQGHGVPDILVAAKGRHRCAPVTWLCEIKDGSKPPSARSLTPQQQEFHSTWPGLLYVCERVEDVPGIIKAALMDCPMGYEA